MMATSVLPKSWRAFDIFLSLSPKAEVIQTNLSKYVSLQFLLNNYNNFNNNRRYNSNIQRVDIQTSEDTDIVTLAE